MGILDSLFNKKDAEELKPFEKLINSIETSDDFLSVNKGYVLNYLKQKLETEDFIFSLDEFSLIVNELNKNYIIFNDKIKIIEKMHYRIVNDKNSYEQKQLFMKMFNIGLNDSFVLSEIIFSDYFYVYDLFENKVLFLNLFEYLVKMNSKLRDGYSYLFKYIRESRQYYVDEIMFFTNIINVLEKYNGFIDDTAINVLLNEDKKKAGIYEVSLNTIEELEYKILSLKEIIAGYEKNIDERYKEANDNISSYEQSLVNRLEKKFEELNKQIIDYNKKIGSNIIDIEAKLKNFNQMFLSLKKELDIANANLLRGEVVSLSHDFENSVELINSLINNSSSLGENERKIIRELGKNYLKLISAISDKGCSEVEVITSNGLNKYLDSSVPLKDRLKSALANKKPNELYHSSVDKIVKEILNNNAVYLVGPSGSCKTYSVKQVAELLGLPLYDFGFVTDEHETFKSYKDVNGKFVKNIFYQAYKNGGICFFDEIDNSESKALVELNRIIGGKGEYEAYLFPNGELVQPHPNFRVVVAGNTYGEGANEAYSTRERLDFGTIDRFSPIKSDYDVEFERQVLKDYPYVYDFCMAYRDALSLVNDEYYFTTRRIFKIKKNLDSGCYSREEIIEDFFTKSLRLDVLEKVCQNMDIDKTNPYYQAFCSVLGVKKNSVKTKVRKV